MVGRIDDSLFEMLLNLLLDYDHYISNQILPPIERLCEPIEGTDRSRLAECLGMCLTLYKELEAWIFPRPWPNAFSNIERGWWTYIFSSWCSDIGCWEVPRCNTIPREMSALPGPTCLFYKRTGSKSIVIGVPDRRSWFLPLKTSILFITGPACPVCSKTISPGSLQTQLEVQIREHIAKYYEGWTVCDDPTCNYSTRMMGVYGRRCLRSGCRGRVAFKVMQIHSYAFWDYHWPKY